MTGYDWFMVAALAFAINRICAALDTWAGGGS